MNSEVELEQKYMLDEYLSHINLNDYVTLAYAEWTISFIDRIGLREIVKDLKGRSKNGHSVQYNDILDVCKKHLDVDKYGDLVYHLGR